MKCCATCPHRISCRVPGDLLRFGEVAHRLEQQHRSPLLQQRLHYYMDRPDCLVDAGYVDP
ncbi:hypothetical protein [Magnetospirillum aberrantis]|uniref:Uncharacterized protein n=1 Tax=Magnetospirillum aberrantis SpK TaxID=908842 RepID=A0A7C9QVY2_9PROT|nr:hypothetical protein [Magnetospirillum aberrantis]NFV80636.1 hypothetical protein [Magnetospirillum aberrantis SpK]